MKILAVTFLAISSAVFGQGALSPTAPPAPSMKSLLELWNKLVTVETQASGIQTSVNALRNDPRTVITSGPVVINNPGSYILGANLSLPRGTAVTISADDVTLDLNGFAIIGYDLPAGGNGVLITGSRRNIHVKNGTIKGTTLFNGSVFAPSGFANGVVCDTATCRNIIVSDMRISGVAVDGVNLGNLHASTNVKFAPGLVVERTSVSVCGNTGILAHSIRTCDVVDSGAVAILGYVVTDSSGGSVGVTPFAHGIAARIVANSSSEANSGHGITATNVFNSMGRSDSGSGISGVGNVTNSYGLSAGGQFGINVLSGTASFCRGYCSVLGDAAIFAPIAIGCTHEPGSFIVSPQKHLGTP